jgi:hypothetical protein
VINVNYFHDQFNVIPSDNNMHTLQCIVVDRKFAKTTFLKFYSTLFYSYYLFQFKFICKTDIRKKITH